MKMNRALIPAFAFVAATWAIGASGQTTQGQTGTMPTHQGSQGQGGTTAQGQGGTTDTGTGAQSEYPVIRGANTPDQFVRKAAIDNQAEIALSQLAVQRAQDPQVKQFAQQMVDQHKQAGDQLKQIASASGLQVPDQLDRKHQKEQQKLSQLNGAAFDRQYLKDMVKAHKQMASLLKDETHNQQAAASGYGATPTGTSGTGTAGTTGTTGQTGQTTGTAGNVSPELRNWASTTLPTVESHLQEAKQLQKSADSSGKNGNSGRQ